MADAMEQLAQAKKLRRTRDTVLRVVFVFVLALAGFFLFLNVDAPTWGHFFGFLQWMLGFWFGSKTITDLGKSIWYRPELDDEHKGDGNVGKN